MSYASDAAADAADLEPRRGNPLRRAAAIACGVAVSLYVTGYTFLQSNQHVYLLDALRFQHPQNLERDWFTTHTLQYHVLYTFLTVGLEKLHALAAGFFTLYLLTAIAMHVAWQSITRSLGGGDRAYLLSVVLYHVSAGGLGLGVYQFLQDGSFLPSNVAAVSALAALSFWLKDRRYAAAACVAVSGIFHVNYALLLGFAWTVFTAVAIVRRRPTRADLLPYALQSAIALVPCTIALYGPAVSALEQPDHLSMDVFVPLYITLRHPHHFDAAHWPALLWLSFLWPLPFAIRALARGPATPARQRTAEVFYLVLALELIATLFAGIWFVSQTLVLTSLFRFSIFAKLISCVLVAMLAVSARRPTRAVLAAGLVVIGIGLLAGIAFREALPSTIPSPSVGLLVGAAIASVAVGVDLVRPLSLATLLTLAIVGLPPAIWLAAEQRLGPAMPGEGDAGMADMSDWVRDHTPIDALFLVPPHDSMFRLEAQRSAVVGFKHVPQLSAELVEWKRRLDDVLGLDVLTLPHPMQATADAMARTYAALPAAHLASVARRYDCDYVIAMRDLGPTWSPRLLYRSSDGRYWLYRVVDLDNATRPSTLPGSAAEER